MLQMVVLIKRSTLLAMSEHSTAITLTGCMAINDTEMLVALDKEVIESILHEALPEDERIDEILLRRVL